MVVSSQNPHQPYTEKLFHHLLSRESGNWKATKILTPKNYRDSNFQIFLL